MSRFVDRIRHQFSDARPAKRAGLILLALAAFTVVGTSAWAYWTTIGHGTASATTGTLNAPSAPATSVSGPGTVHLSWTGSALSNDTPAQGYYVTRSSGPAPATCGTPTAPLAAMACDDTGVADGTYTYTVTAVYGSWTATSPASDPPVTVVNDSTPPVVTVTSVNGSARTFPYSTNVDVTSFGGSCGTLTGDSTMVTPLLNGAATAPATATCDSGTWTLTLTTALSTDGSRTLSARQSDAAGNTGTAPGQTVTIDKTAPLVSVTSVNGSVRTFPYFTNANVTSIGGTCGTLTGDLATVSPLIGGFATVPATTTCGSGTWSLTLTTALSTEGSQTLSATQSDAAGNTGTAPSQTLARDTTPPSVTVNQKLGQADPTNVLPMLWTVTFSEPVTGFDATDLTRGGTATGGTVSVTGSGASYEISLSGTPTNGSTTFSIAASRALDLAGNNNTASTSTDNSISYDTTPPSVTVNQKLGQADPTNVLPMLWTVTFSEPVTGFDATDLTRGGTATGGTVSVTGSGASYEISLSGTPTNGSTTFSIAASRALDLAGNNNTASTSTDNSISYDTTAPTVVSMVMQDTNTNGKVDRVLVTFSEPLVSSTAATPPWTLANVPSGGSLTSVSTSGVVATLVLTEGVSAADTSVGSFTVALVTDVTGIRDAAGNQSSFSAMTPTDGAGPVAIAATNSDANGKMENGDTLGITFSEALSGFVAGPTGTATQDRNGNSSPTLNVPILFSGNPTISDTYQTKSSQTTATTTRTLSGDGKTVLITLSAGSGLSNATAGTGTLAVTPVVTGLHDASGNPAIAASVTFTRLW